MARRYYSHQEKKGCALSSNLHREGEGAFGTLHPNLLIAVARSLRLVAAARLRGRADLEDPTSGYYEFGLYQGFSFWFANNLADDLGLHLQFHGFDSFAGLPKSTIDVHRNWRPGSYACTRSVVERNFTAWGMPSPFYLHEGFYSASYFEEVRKNYPLPSPAVVVVDCDLYESARDVLAFIGDLWRPGTIILFDDFNAFKGDPDHGERRALREFELSRPGFSKEYLFSFGRFGEAFRVVTV